VKAPASREDEDEGKSRGRAHLPAHALRGTAGGEAPQSRGGRTARARAGAV